MRKFGKRMLVFGMSAALAASAGGYAYASNKGSDINSTKSSDRFSDEENDVWMDDMDRRDGRPAERQHMEGQLPPVPHGQEKGGTDGSEGENGFARPGEHGSHEEGDSLTKPERPEEHNGSDGVARPEKPEEHSGSDGVARPERPEERNGSDGVDRPEKPEERNGSDGVARPGRPEERNGSDDIAKPERPEGFDGNNSGRMDGRRIDGQLPPAPHGQERNGSTGSDGIARPERPAERNGSDGVARPEKPEERNGSDGIARPGQPEERNESDGVARPEKPEGIRGNDSGRMDGRRIDGQLPPAPHGQERNGATGSDGIARPERPTDHNGSNGATRPERPEGRNGSDGVARPERPEERSSNGGGNGMGGNSSVSYDSANTLTEDAENQSYSSTSDSQNAVLVDGSTVTISNSSIQKSGNSSSEEADFYGINAAVLANNGANLEINDAEISTSGSHANAVFSYGSGTEITISNSNITTTGNNSGGLMTTGGATLNANNLTVSTSGNSSAAIRSDRGGGTVNVENGNYRSSGVGSPAIYSTADITVTGAALNASNSEAVVIEGGNSVTLTDAEVSGNNATLNGQSTQKTNVLIYQSMSGDASGGNSSFTMNGGTLTAGTGSMFHVTNVSTTISLTNVDLHYAEDSNVLLDASADSWGSTGRNGGNVNLNLSQQSIEGDILVDSVSSLALRLADSSSYRGAINQSHASSDVSVTLEAGSTWTLTGDSYVTSFDGDLTQVNTNGHTLYINGVAANA